ncbi:uncharacterized protein K452DRAFT_357874 [Aplosporella prunicola CBS 121167]|uniref:Protein PBN1 n=1 Tax=Aplosporella prunicola CBS 121167 TaxID=1176127 RepID=A0A6A6BF39_9PEZI|nr:uncharacterized protein K452DRAFT_357874 [Aplosporella prunicola CBS 121167]KAF2142789.1 hypothetical protein K452DRAFT_357874 [Aplosporella prunicola CBS 121167]
MKQRITYLLHPGEPAFDPAGLTVRKDSLQIKPIKAAKEHRLTLGLAELPQEIRTVLKQCHELHLRWASSEPYTATPPFTSRVSPGLHAFFSPRKGQQPDGLCPLLKKLFDDDLKCASPKESFIGLPVLSERFSSSAASQYYHLLPNLDNLITYIQQALCSSSDPACQDQAASLRSAQYLDIDYDTISHALIVNAFWAQGPNPDGQWTSEITLGTKSEKIEVGILNNEKPLEAEELSLAGFLTVIGEDTKAKPAMFSFPSRHHPLPHPLTFETSFAHPTGLHPTLELRFPSAAALAPPLPTASCALHAHLTLPSALFLDKHQFSDPLFLASQNLKRLHAFAGATDLEAPDWVVPQWGSAALLELAPPAPAHDYYDSTTPASEAAHADADAEAVHDLVVSVPLHLRYLAPAHNVSGIRAAALPAPVVFWACAADEGAKMAASPFDRANLGWDGLFGGRTLFYDVPPAGWVGKLGVGTRGVGEGSGRAGVGEGKANANATLVQHVPVPVLDLDRAAWVEAGTVGAVLLGAAWVAWTLWGAVFTGRGGGRRRTAAAAAAAARKRE